MHFEHTTNLQILREGIRNGSFTKETSGFVPGNLQGNVVILPKRHGKEFLDFCAINQKTCPIIAYSEAGDYALPSLGLGLDIRVDVPEYCIFVDGNLVDKKTNIKDIWQDDFMSIILGCSYSFEDALKKAGCLIRNIEQGLNVSMYNTNIPTQATDNFKGEIVVSMRPFEQNKIDQVKAITSLFPLAHGSPIHVGAPNEIGIADLACVDYGDAVNILDHEIPVFWGCGVTSQRILRNAKLPLAITHAPGKMLVCDITYSNLRM